MTEGQYELLWSLAHAKEVWVVVAQVGVMDERCNVMTQGGLQDLQEQMERARGPHNVKRVGDSLLVRALKFEHEGSEDEAVPEEQDTSET